MIYLDTSVALAHLLAEDRQPPDDLWTEELWSSRLLEYELWNRIHARDLARSHAWMRFHSSYSRSRLDQSSSSQKTGRSVGRAPV